MTAFFFLFVEDFFEVAAAVVSEVACLVGGDITAVAAANALVVEVVVPSLFSSLKLEYLSLVLLLLDPDIPADLEEEGVDGALLRSRPVVVEVIVLIFLLFLMFREVFEQQDDDDIRSGDVNASTLADDGRIVVATVLSRMAVETAMATTTTTATILVVVVVAAAVEGFIVEIMVVMVSQEKEERCAFCGRKKDSEEYV